MPGLGGGGEPCVLCNKRCYPAESMYTSSGQLFHQGCFRCTKCRRPLAQSTYAQDATSKRLYCQTHYKQLAAEVGIDAVARGGVDATQTALVETEKVRAIAEEMELLKVGSSVWIAVDELDAAQRDTLPANEPFCSAVISASADDDTFTVRRNDGGKPLTVPQGACSLADDVTNATVVDNLMLLHLTEPNLVHNLRCRFDERMIYTWTGEYELLALNPYEQLQGLYADCHPYVQSADAGVTGTGGNGKTPPHVYAVAERVYLGAAVRNAAQSIVVSGDSGAGKTETNKYLLEYLRWRSSRGGDAAGQAHAETICSSIMVANRLLECFGNAATVANDNSSRFGKYLQLGMGQTGAIARGGFRCFMLERSRVVRQRKGERNFHCFAYLLHGGSCQPPSPRPGAPHPSVS